MLFGTCRHLDLQILLQSRLKRRDGLGHRDCGQAAAVLFRPCRVGQPSPCPFVSSSHRQMQYFTQFFVHSAVREVRRWQALRARAHTHNRCGTSTNRNTSKTKAQSRKTMVKGSTLAALAAGGAAAYYLLQTPPSKRRHVHNVSDIGGQLPKMSIPENLQANVNPQAPRGATQKTIEAKKQQQQQQQP